MRRTVYTEEEFYLLIEKGRADVNRGKYWVCDKDRNWWEVKMAKFKVRVFEKPGTTEEIQRYNPKRGILTKSQEYKIRKLVEYKCIERTGPNTWIVKPIQGYNSTTYTVTCKEGEYTTCTCQYNVMHDGLKECSHIGAMILAGGLTMAYVIAEDKQLTF